MIFTKDEWDKKINLCIKEKWFNFYKFFLDYSSTEKYILYVSLKLIKSYFEITHHVFIIKPILNNYLLYKTHKPDLYLSDYPMQ